MNRLEELIQQYCPDGVENKKLEECCQILDNKRKPITKGARVAGEYPYYGANGIQDYVADYIFDGKYVLVGEDGSVITSNGTPVVNWAEGKIWVNNHAHIISEKDGVLLRYLFHYLQTINISPLIHGNIPKLTGGDFRALTIPDPPLPVQEEIVRILDTFTELQAELQAELQKRLQQYNYYRDNLLSFEGRTNVEWISIDQLFLRRNGYTPSKSNVEFWTNGTIPWFRMEDIRENGRILTNSIQKIHPSAVKKNALFKSGSIIVATSATIGEHALVLVDCLANQRFTCLTVKDEYKNKVDNMFLFYYMFKVDEWCKTHTVQGNFPGVDMSQFPSVLIPLPSIEEQKRIATILDRFNSLTTDITAGLPSEIEARRKQNEYYRAQLLTFKQKA